jgi:hypothetical protein
MDIKMGSTNETTLKWDLVSVNGIVSFITDDEEELQSAQFATFLNLGSTPQLPDKGVDWLGFFSGSTSFGTVDSQIRNNISLSRGPDYFPYYELINNKIKATVRKG